MLVISVILVVVVVVAGHLLQKTGLFDRGQGARSIDRVGAVTAGARGRHDWLVWQGRGYTSAIKSTAQKKIRGSQTRYGPGQERKMHAQRKTPLAVSGEWRCNAISAGGRGVRWSPPRLPLMS